MGAMAIGSLLFVLGLVLFIIGNTVENWAEGTKIAMGVIAGIGIIMIGGGWGVRTYDTQHGGLIENFVLDSVSSTAISEYAI